MYRTPQNPAATSSSADPADLKHLNQEQLARRWRISPRTLERWRWLKEGPPYLRIGGRVAYRLVDVEAFETANLKQSPVAEPIR
jgi:hypothetical protein